MNKTLYDLNKTLFGIIIYRKYMKNYFYLIGLLLGGVLASCGTADVLTIDQLRPAEMSFPVDLRQVGVVNNMKNRPNAPTDQLILGLVQGENVAATEAIAGALADSKFFDQVVICDSALQSEENVGLPDPILSADEVRSLSTQLGVDMLVSLEDLWVETSKQQVRYPGWDVPLSVLKTHVSPVVRLYLPSRTQPLHTIALTDSIYWDMEIPLTEKMVLEEATRLAATKVADYLTPSWKQVERVYFYGGCVEMRDAAVYLREGSWQEAQDLWKELFHRRRKGTTKARAAYNIALSYEMLGDIDQAIKWVSESQKYVSPKSNEEKIVKYYSEALANRIREVGSLKTQMHRFNDNF